MEVLILIMWNLLIMMKQRKDTLIDIDLHIHSGETVGIIGGTGCAKIKSWSI